MTAEAFYWMRLPEFQTAYYEARRAAFGQSIARLQQGSSAAVSTLLKIMVDPNSPMCHAYAPGNEVPALENTNDDRLALGTHGNDPARVGNGPDPGGRKPEESCPSSGQAERRCKRQRYFAVNERHKQARKRDSGTCKVSRFQPSANSALSMVEGSSQIVCCVPTAYSWTNLSPRPGRKDLFAQADLPEEPLE